MHIEGIDHVLIVVGGMDRSLGFYEGVLGAAVGERLPQHAMVELRAGASRIGLVDIDDPLGAWARPGVQGGVNVNHIALRIANYEAAQMRAHLNAHAVSIVEERIEPGGHSLYVTDPSGNTIELILSN